MVLLLAKTTQGKQETKLGKVRRLREAAVHCISRRKENKLELCHALFFVLENTLSDVLHQLHQLHSLLQIELATSFHILRWEYEAYCYINSVVASD
jgi:hypothetical protein